MAFHYTPQTPDDVTRVRFHTNDTNCDAYRFEDAEIAFMIAECGGWKPAVIACIEAMIAEVANTPDFKADWLTVDSSKALASLSALLATKRKTLGQNAITASSASVYRVDSLQTNADYSET